MDKQFVINYQEYTSLEEMPDTDRELLTMAIRAAEGAYAPYSHFHVGAALRLTNGSVVCGNNQENAAYPSGLCAERTALFSASAKQPKQRDYEALAIVGRTAEGKCCAASPCGACRQVMLEYEQLQNHPMRVICYVTDTCIRVFGSVTDLLPFSFELGK